MDTTPEDTRRKLTFPAWETLLAGLLVLIYVAFDARFLGDGDTYWHVAAGAWMLEHRAVLFADPFSFTFAGKDWHAHEWLAELVFALAYRLSGWAGVLLVTGAAVAVAIGSVYSVARRNLSLFWAAFASLLALVCAAPNLLARPHIFGVALLAVWTRVLLDARSANRAPSLFWLLLVVVWANMHGSVLFGLALIAAFALEALNENLADWRRTVREWVLFGIGAGFAALLTPRGIEGVVFLVELTRMGSLKSIAEWMPPSFAEVTGLMLLVGAGLFALLYRGVKVPLVRLLLLLGMLYMTLNHQRHQVLMATTGTMLVCAAIGRGGLSPATGWKPPRWASPLLVLAILTLGVVRLVIPARIAESERSPQGALAKVPADLRSRPVLNAYSAGGFLISQGIRPFIDGRTDLYGDAFFKRYEAVVDDRGGALGRALTEYAIDWTLLETNSRAVQALDANPQWQRVHSDRFVTVHQRIR